MSAAASRRGFLRGLTTLPLIGGAITLIGTPSAIAEPATDSALDAYVAFLAHEHRAALIEHERRRAVRSVATAAAQGQASWPGYVEECEDIARQRPPMFWFPGAPDTERLVASAEPSSRAALVLSAVGCDWRRV